MTPTDPRLAYGSLPVLIWTVRPDGTCDYLNERWIDFTGRPPAEMLGWGWLDLLHPDDRERVAAECTRALASRTHLRVEFRMVHADGDYRWVLGMGEPCYLAGEFIGYSGCTTDVTDRRALEERLAELGRSGEIAQLAGGIAHDFNNLLTGILAMSPCSSTRAPSRWRPGKTFPGSGRPRTAPPCSRATCSPSVAARSSRRGRST
jgi:PAS domain S-box-containing protein